MSAEPEDYKQALNQAHQHVTEWLEAIPSRAVRPRVTASELADAFGGPLPAIGSDPANVVDELARLAEPGLMAMPSGRFFGWVIGGTLPAALGADWLVSAWDQNTALRAATPATAAIEQAAGDWLLELLGLPAGSDVGFTTGGMMANFVGLASGRQFVLDRAGWDVSNLGLTGGPRVNVFVGADRHATVDRALRYLGLGAPTALEVDEQGRVRVKALAEALAQASGPTIVCLQAGNLHSGAFDPIADASTLAHERGAWVHVDGAFGLWAAASPQHSWKLAGLETCDSWATDAHKTLNVPYDCGVAIVSRPEVLRSVFSAHTNYLLHDTAGPGDPFEKVPEFSRRSRGVPVWAAIRSLGRQGVIGMVDRMVDIAQEFADRLDALPGVEILNEVAFTQVCLSFGSDERTRSITARLLADGTTWMSGSRWADRDVLRISVSNWSTDADDVIESVEAVKRAIAAEDAG